MKAYILKFLLLFIGFNTLKAQCLITIANNINNGCAPLQVMFAISAINTGTAVWSLDNTTLNGLSIQHTFFNPGNYTVTLNLIATTATGTCSATASTVVNVVTGPANGCSTTVGLNEFQKEAEIDLYPNPNQGEFNIHLNNDARETELILIDAKGQKVLEQKLYPGLNTISSKYLPAGLYTCTLFEEGRLSGYKKVIIE